MDWTQTVIDTDVGYVAWIDERKANAWFQEAARLMSNESWASCHGDGRCEIDLVRNAWLALSYGYQCCDLSPWAEPKYREEILRAYGRARMGPVGGIRGYGSEYWLNAAGAGFTEEQEREADARAVANPDAEYERVSIGDFGGRFARRVYDDYMRLHPGNTTGRYWLVVQCALAQDARLSTRCVYGPDGIAGSDCDFAFVGPNCAPRGGLSIQWGPSCWAWRHPPLGDKVILPPMVGGGVADIVKAVAESCVERGAVRVLDDAVRNAFLLNAATAARLHLLPAELIDAAARSGIDLTHWNGNGPRNREWDVAFATMYTAAAVASAATVGVAPWLGALLGAVIGAGDLFTRIVGDPALIVTDQFGQIDPVFVTWRLSGRPGANVPANAPTQTVPDPPDYHAHVGTPSPLMTGLLANTLLPTITAQPAPPVRASDAATTVVLGPMIDRGGGVSIERTPTAPGPTLTPLTPPPQSAPESSTLETVAKVVGVGAAGAAIVGTIVSLVRRK